MDPTTITREALHERVWAEPMKKVAQQLGISGSTLASLCDRHGVARPPQGHWTRLELGRPVTIEPLGPAPKGVPEQITITPMVRRTTQSVAPAGDDGVEPPKPASAVPDRLTKPHPLVAEWIATREKQIREKREVYDSRLKRLVKPAPFTPAERRRLIFANTLFKALEQQGVAFKRGERRELLMSRGSEQLEFQIRYRMKRGRRDLTPDEMRWKAKGSPTWEYALYDTDSLLFEIKTWLSAGATALWEDSKKGTLEQRFNDVIAGILAAFPALKALKEEREAERRSYEEIARLRREREEAAKLDAARFRRLLELAGQWREAELAHAFIARIRERLPVDAPDVDGKKVNEWLAWAERKIGEHDRSMADPRAVLVSIADVTRWTYS